MRSARKIMWATWALVPVGFAAFHFGPGRPLAAGAHAGSLARASLRLEREGDAEGTFEALTKALEALPPTTPLETRRALELRCAKAQVDAGQILEGMNRLETLVGELDAEGSSRSETGKDARSALASAAYYATWVMRLEGAAADEWKPMAERARQDFRLLAEQAAATNDEDAPALQRNLEATIRLEQMDLTELVALPLPKQCSSCSGNLSQRCRDQRLSKCKGGSKQNKDARQKIKGAGQGRREGIGW